MSADPGRPQERPLLRLVAPDNSPTADAGEPSEGIEVSPDVVQAVGAATVMRLRADPRLREYACPFCDRPPAGTASLIVIRYANRLSVVRLAHATCSPSTVLRMLAGPTRLCHRVRATCWLRPTGAGTASAILLVDNRVRVWRRHRARDRDDEERYARALESAGFVQATDVDNLPPERPGLAATLMPAGRIRVIHPNAVVFDGSVAIPSAWARQARRNRAVIVVTGTDLAPAVRWRSTADDARWLLDGVTAALAAGRAWTAVAALSPAGESPQLPATAGQNPPEARAG